MYDESITLKYNYKKVKKDSKWGLLNQRDELITEIIFDSIEDFGYYFVFVELNGFKGFVGKRGEIIMCKVRIWI